jgi:hypothetical protein
MTEVSFQFKGLISCRDVYAGVSLVVHSSSAGFEFVDEVRWPETNYSKFVEDGVMAGLSEAERNPDMFRIVLNSVNYDPAGSSGRAFYLAAKSAIQGYFTVKSEWTDSSSSTNPKG